MTLRTRQIAACALYAILFSFFAAGYLAVCQQFRENAIAFLALNLIALAFSILTLPALTANVRESLVAWLIYLGFIGCYYFKFYLMVLWPSLMRFVPLSLASSPAVVSSDNLLNTFALITLGFGVSCGSILGFYGVHPRRAPALKPLIPRQSLRYAFVIALILGIVTSIIVFHYGMTMGTAITKTLPFHLRGIVTLSRSTLIPMLLLLILQYSIERQRRDMAIGSIILILCFGLSSVLLEGTKAGLGFMILMALLIPILLGHRIRLKVIAVTLIILIVSVAAFFPFMGAFRKQRGSGLTLTESIALLHPDELLAEDPWLPIKYLTMRVTGADAFAVLLNANQPPLGLQFWRKTASYKWGVSGYINEEIFQIPSELDELGMWSAAPSLLGFFYVIDGAWGIAIGMILFTVGVLLIWEKLLGWNLIAGPAIEAVLLTVLFGTFMDGTVQLFLRNDLTSIAISGLMLEQLARSGRQEKPRTSSSLVWAFQKGTDAAL